MARRKSPASAQAVRIDYDDLALTWHALRDATEVGKGVVRRVALDRGIDASRITRAIDRVEASFGGSKFLVTGRRRTAALTAAGLHFLKAAPALMDRWDVLRDRLSEIEADERERASSGGGPEGA